MQTVSCDCQGGVVSSTGCFDPITAQHLNHFLICPMGQHHPYNYRRVCDLPAFHGCTSGSFMFVYVESICENVTKREEKQDKLREEGEQTDSLGCVGT